MPRVLSDTDVADFRERLCEAAERLFAERGPDAVTMRQLAAELGVSPMTPYRYFEDKDDILAAVRANGFNRFAQALEQARAGAKAGGKGAREIGQAVGDAYVAFAIGHPHSYKLMFDFNQPHVEKYPELVAAGQRAQKTMTGHVEDAIAEGIMAGDPQQIGMMFWAAIHGAVILELAGMVPPGVAAQLFRGLDQILMRGIRPEG
jgi:AcrR family transcriptional regulator